MATGTILAPSIVDALLDDLAERYAACTGEPVDSARRLVELAVLQRGCLAVQRELDEAVPVVVVAERESA